MQERFTVAQPSAVEDKGHLDWGRLLSVYGAVALGIGLVLSDHYVVGIALIIWGAADY